MSPSISPDRPGGARPPAGPARLLRNGRMLKRWRYVALFSEQLMACAAHVQVGPARQSFWALFLREHGELRERTRMLPWGGGVELLPAATLGRPHGRSARRSEPAPGRGLVRIDQAGVRLELELTEEPGIEALCAHGRGGEVWTRKQAGIAARGTLALDGGSSQEIEALALIDDTAGYHARHTEWWWSAGVGQGRDGQALAWNLVSGVNDPPRGSERAVWVKRRPHEVGAVSFAPDLRLITGEDGSQLSFEPHAQRSRKDDLLVFRSEYRAPFGAFHGTLPGGIALAQGLGVVEHHRALW